MAYDSDEEGNSPFKPPNDEEVFLTRETEKQKKKDAKARAKNSKIWDKKTASNEVIATEKNNTKIIINENKKVLFKVLKKLKDKSLRQKCLI